MKLNVDLIYPIGAIYMSTDSTSPATLFGGQWSQIKGRFLLGVSDDYAVSSTGGEATHKLTIDEMPSHNHVEVGTISNNSGPYQNQVGRGITGYSAQQSSNTTSSTGGNAAHNNMPPYYAVYIWRRTS